eukprot:TRINITY_DN5208_c0_g1_i1.p2 TRINITY_DN5208_c0_g1~~TRINITY_DN5208_c0_g1_i1.p2  ORF type:complete len:155 (-),score=42.21 TRINITY_DN5208_c0_g1_i1:27-491(-)
MASTETSTTTVTSSVKLPDSSFSIKATLDTVPTERYAQPTSGKPVAGRYWKPKQTAKFSSVRNVKELRSSWETKLKEKMEKKKLQEMEKAMREEKRLTKRKAREEKIERQKRNEEYLKKAEVVQEIKNPKKIKKLTKKQFKLLKYVPSVTNKYV